VGGAPSNLHSVRGIDAVAVPDGEPSTRLASNLSTRRIAFGAAAGRLHAEANREAATPAATRTVVREAWRAL
jgi:hypothetical protein